MVFGAMCGILCNVWYVCVRCGLEGNRSARIGVGFKSEVCFWNPMPLNLLERSMMFRFLFVCLVHNFLSRIRTERVGSFLALTFVATCCKLQTSQLM
jgi:hypothetical protein